MIVYDVQAYQAHRQSVQTNVVHYVFHRPKVWYSVGHCTGWKDRFAIVLELELEPELELALGLELELEQELQLEGLLVAVHSLFVHHGVQIVSASVGTMSASTRGAISL